jgi:hypothetical protein
MQAQALTSLYEQDPLLVNRHGGYRYLAAQGHRFCTSHPHFCQIRINTGALAIVDSWLYDFLTQWTWQAHPQGYALRNYSLGRNRSTYLLHHHIVTPLPGFVIDHVNENVLDCRRANLEPVTQRENLVRAIRNKKARKQAGAL